MGTLPVLKTLSLVVKKRLFVEPSKIIIALDGHSSCGKSTYAKRIAAELGYAYIDSGAMYRAVTLACMDAGLFDSSDSPSLEDVEDQLEQVELDLRFNPDKTAHRNISEQSYG